MRRIGDIPKNLLVVDKDSSPLREAVRTAIEGADAELKFEWAGDLSSAVERLRHHGVDVVLMGLDLPDAYGVAAFEKLQVLSTDIPVVVAAGPGEEGVAAKCVALGAQDSVSIDDVTAAVLPRVLRYAAERHRLLGALCDLAAVDELTELYSRKGLIDLGQQTLRTARRMAKDVLMIHLDIDGLTGINHSLGHDCGDEVLLATASVLMDVFRSTDLVARVGPDEFAVLAMDAGPSNGPSLLGRFMDAVADLESKRLAPCTMQYTFGVAGLEERPNASVEDLLLEAESDNRSRAREVKSDHSAA